ncbi:MAG: hypothetical protein U9R15_11085 [Chloroflexota bacterium]|nr:hypothetical protein [Chloroflexota bacterium]
MPLENVIEFLQANWANLAMWAGIIALFLLLRNRATRIGGLDEVLGRGEPVIVELFSNT